VTAHGERPLSRSSGTDSSLSIYSVHRPRRWEEERPRETPGNASLMADNSDSKCHTTAAGKPHPPSLCTGVIREGTMVFTYIFLSTFAVSVPTQGSGAEDEEAQITWS
jgi:hypothetical protein